MITTSLAAIYVRVSRDTQADNYSLPTQEAACRSFAAERGLTVHEAHIYREVHTASELYERPALAACREAMVRGEFNVLICYDPDRFSRNQIHTALLQHYCDRDGVELKFAAFDFENSPTGRFLLQARAFAAELELEKIKERTMRGLRGRALSGKLTRTTPAPFGYQYADGTRVALVIDPVTGPIVREMFARIAEGWTLRSVAADLNRRGIPTPRGGDRWLFTTVKSIAYRRYYLGEARALTTRTVKKGGKKAILVRPESEQVMLPEGTVPPLIDRESFDAAQARLARNKAEASRNSRQPESFLLRAGYLRCAGCGRSVSTAFRRERNGVETPLYRTHKDKHPAGCLGERSSLSTVARSLDARVWTVVQEHLLEPEKFVSLVPTATAADPTADALAAIESLIADVEKRQANLVATMMLISNDEARAPLAAQMEALAEQRRKLLTEREGRRAVQANWQAGQERERGLIAWWRNAAANAEHLDYAGKRDALDRLGIRVTITREGICTVLAARDPEHPITLCTLDAQSIVAAIERGDI